MIQKNKLTEGVMFNAYPDSIGERLEDCIQMLQLPEFRDVFSLFYVLPTFFNSDLDRGFSIIDYDLNKDLVSREDLSELENLNISLKFDIILNHLSVASPQFQDLLQSGEKSIYRDFFIDWNTFWEGKGTLNDKGLNIPGEEYLSKLFMRKAGLPILNVRFPDGSEKPFWNTFYQEVIYHSIEANELVGISIANPVEICKKINEAIAKNEDLAELDLGGNKSEILKIVEQKRTYLGQMDVNGKSPLVWEFYEETLKKLKGFGCKILRLDAFAYLHKEIGQSNFFNKPGTWEYLERFSLLAKKYDLVLLPEIHAEYGLHLHDEVAEKGYHIYDFFLPGLLIHALETGKTEALCSWAKEIVDRGFKTVNMLGCHDGIPVLDLKGKEIDGVYRKGLLEDSEIEAIMNRIIERGGRVKNLYGPNGEKISYYQVNATFYSALGENPRKMLLARAIQMFMPGIPQVWYLDVFAGKNDYAAADNGGAGGHKEINRTTLSLGAVKEGLKNELVINQLEIIKLRNTSNAFTGSLNVKNDSNLLEFHWQNGDDIAILKADLSSLYFSISHSVDGEMLVKEF